MAKDREKIEDKANEPVANCDQYICKLIFFLIHIKYFSLKHLDIKEKNRIFAASFKITLKGKQYGCSYK